MDGLFLGLAIVVLLLIGAAGARWDAPVWVALPSFVLLGVLYWAGVLVLAWTSIGTTSLYLVAFLVVGGLYTWAWWELKLRRARTDADTNRLEILKRYAEDKRTDESLQDYMMRAGDIPMAVNNKAEITGRVVVWPMHLLGDILIYPGRWILSILRYMREFFDRRAKAKFADFK